MRVADDLKPHNRETIRRILDFFKTERKCCAIQATGTGKTFLILRLLEILNDEGKVAVIFAPNNEIIRQTKRRMKKFGLNNATFYTYQKLARMTDEELSEIKTDLIVCDELHRTGAKTWGQKFEQLVNLHPDSKVFGVTATPLRCADGRDMAEEYFDGNKACDISLAEALVREIIPVMPVYVSALYTFEEEYQKMSDKIDKANNSNEEKTELQKELLVAKQQLEKANGVPEIIKKYITNYNGKYLVFCKDKKHLYAMKDVVIGWFREAGYNGKIYEYPYYSNSSSVRKNLKNFEDNKEEGLKLLFVIDKLNEGLHLDEIQGCLLLRPTCSNITYYQQIGRAIDAGSKEKRIIFDLVSNFNYLKKCNLKKDLEEKVKERRSGKFSDCSEEFELDKFNVVDCVQECVEVFNKIDENILGEKWTEKEDVVLASNYKIIGLKGICEKNIFPSRTRASIAIRAKKLGLTKKNNSRVPLTEKDKDVINKKYCDIGLSGLCEELPHLNKSTIWRYIKNLPDYKKTKRNILTDVQKDFIEKNYNIYSSKELEKILDLPQKTIISYANTQGITKNKNNHKYVYYDKSKNNWFVSIRINGKPKNFGRYTNEHEAIKVAMEKAKEYGKVI